MHTLEQVTTKYCSFHGYKLAMFFLCDLFRGHVRFLLVVESTVASV